MTSKRVLSLLMAVMMLAVYLPAGHAEAATETDLIVVTDETSTEAVACSEEDSSAAFAEGYVRVKAGAVVYSTPAQTRRSARLHRQELLMRSARLLRLWTKTDG